MYKFTPQQKEGMGHLIDWYTIIAVSQPDLVFRYSPYLYTPAKQIVGWLESRIEGDGYDEPIKGVLNAIREFYVVNRGKGGSDELVSEIDRELSK